MTVSGILFLLRLLLEKRSGLPPCLRLQLMLRIAIASAAFATIISYGAFSVFAQSLPPNPKYPAEIAAVSMLLVQKE